MLKRALTTSGDEENYSEFDLLDEQMVVSVQQLKMDDAKIKYSKPIRYESTAFLDQSQWLPFFLLFYFEISTAKWVFCNILMIRLRSGKLNLKIFARIGKKLI